MNAALLEQLRPALADGQRRLADAMRAYCGATDPELLAFLRDTADDEVFLEPLLFAYVRAQRDGVPPIELAQALIGYVQPEARPDQVDVRTDEHGRVYVARLGWFTTARPYATLRLHDAGTLAPRLTDVDGVAVAHAFEPIAWVPGTQIELYRHGHPLCQVALRDPAAPRQAAFEIAPTEAERASLTRAFGLLRAHAPALAGDLAGALRAVCLFSHSDLNSRAAIGCHGVAFINVGREPIDEIMLVDELAHQGGHVVLNACMADARRFFAIDDPHAPMREHGGPLDDGRSVYTWLHGLYTELRMIEALTAVAADRPLAPRKAHELRGRLADTARKLALDLPLAPATLAGDGLAIYAECQATLADLEARDPELASLDLSGQPYTFSYQRFVRANPVAWREVRAS